MEIGSWYQRPGPRSKQDNNSNFKVKSAESLSPKGYAISKANTAKKQESSTDTIKDKTSRSFALTVEEYSDIPSNLLSCHICSKKFESAVVSKILIKALMKITGRYCHPLTCSYYPPLP